MLVMASAVVMSLPAVASAASVIITSAVAVPKTAGTGNKQDNG
jgi:hypothetical protein